MMTQRTFQHRVSAVEVACILIIAAMALWAFWHRSGYMVGVAFLLACLDVAVIERVIHTTYTLTTDGHLVIDKGRFASKTAIPLVEIFKMEQMGAWWRPTHYILITYGSHRVVSVQPDNEEAFIAEIQKRQKRLEKEK